LITNKYDIGQIIAPFKQTDPKLWEALSQLNKAVSANNQAIFQNQVDSLYHRITFSLPSTASGTDILRYVVEMVIDASNVAQTSKLNLTQLIISTKVASSGDEIDIQLSNDRGTTWRSILKTTADPAVTYNKGTIPAGLTLFSYGINQFASNVLYANDFLRVDLVSGSGSDVITVDLIGNFSLIGS